MSRKSLSYHIEDSLLFKIFSLVFFAGLLFYTGYQLKMKRDENLRQARVALEEVKERLQKAARVSGTLDSGSFKEASRGELSRVEPLLLLAVSSPREGLLYTLSRSRSYLVDPPESPSAVRQRLDLRYNPLLAARLDTPFNAGGDELRLDALFRVLNGRDVFPILKDVMIILFAFIVAVVLFILIALSTTPRAGGGDEAGGEGRPGGGRPPGGRSLFEEPPEEEEEEPGGRGEEPSPGWTAPGKAEARPPAAIPSGAAPSSAPATPGRDAGSPAPSPAPAAGTAGPAQAPQAPPPARAGRTLFSTRSGLVWGEYLGERLRFELERAASFDQDLSLALIIPDSLSRQPPALPAASVEPVYRRLAQAVAERYPLRDLVFELKGYMIGLIVPDRSLDQSIVDLESFRKSAQERRWEGEAVTVSIGLSSRNGRLISPDILLREARASLARAVREGGNQLIAFRADPDKFRKVVSAR